MPGQPASKEYLHSQINYLKEELEKLKPFYFISERASQLASVTVLPGSTVNIRPAHMKEAMRNLLQIEGKMSEDGMSGHQSQGAGGGNISSVDKHLVTKLKTQQECTRRDLDEACRQADVNRDKIYENTKLVQELQSQFILIQDNVRKCA